MVINQQWLSPLVLFPLSGPCGHQPINSTLQFWALWLAKGFKIRFSLYCWVSRFSMDWKERFSNCVCLHVCLGDVVLKKKGRLQWMRWQTAWIYPPSTISIQTTLFTYQRNSRKYTKYSHYISVKTAYLAPPTLKFITLSQEREKYFNVLQLHCMTRICINHGDEETLSLLWKTFSCSMATPQTTVSSQP